MSERILKVLLSELATVRLRCKHDGCGTVFEMPLRSLADRKYEKCPVCARPLVEFPKNEHCYGLNDLAKAIAFIETQKNLGVEFVIPEQSE